MAVHVSHAELPYPIRNARYSMLVPYLDADGDPTLPTTPDTEISKDNAAAADCAEEVSVTSGMDGVALMTFTGAEMDAATAAINAKVASGPKATLMTLYPRRLVILESGTAQAGAAGTVTLASGATSIDIAGCFVRTTGGTGGGGTGGANNQARKIISYNASTKVATIAPNWETNPASDTTYDVLLPEGLTAAQIKTLNPTTAGRTLDVASTGEAGIDLGNMLLPVGPIPAFGIAENGTAQSATGTDVVVRSATEPFANDTILGATIMVRGSTQGYWQVGLVSDYVASTKTVTGTWPTGFVTPTGTVTYIIFSTAPGTSSSGLDAAGVRAALGMASASYDTDIAGVNTKLNTIDDFIDTEIATLLTNLATVSGFIDTEVAAIKAKTDLIPAGGFPSNFSALSINGSGFVTLADASLTAAKFGANAIAAAALAADALAAIAAGVRDVQTADTVPGVTARPTIGQAVRYNYLVNTQRSRSSTTETIKKEDGATTAATCTYDDATNPTSIVRAT